jgi:hypothetical protein
VVKIDQREQAQCAGLTTEAAPVRRSRAVPKRLRAISSRAGAVCCFRGSIAAVDLLPGSPGGPLLVSVVLERRSMGEGVPFDSDLGPCSLYGPVGRIQGKLLTGQCLEPISFRGVNHVEDPLYGGSTQHSLSPATTRRDSAITHRPPLERKKPTKSRENWSQSRHTVVLRCVAMAYLSS